MTAFNLLGHQLEMWCRIVRKESHHCSVSLTSHHTCETLEAEPMNKQLTICQKQIRFMHKRPMSFLWRTWLFHTVNSPLRHSFVCNCIEDLLLQRLNHLHSFSFSTCTLVSYWPNTVINRTIAYSSYSLNINSHHLSIKYIASLSKWFYNENLQKGKVLIFCQEISMSNKGFLNSDNIHAVTHIPLYSSTIT